MVVDNLILVPARGGSKRLPGKNLRRLGDKTLLQWTQWSIAQAALTAPVLLTTDDPDIASAGRALGWDVPFLRPAHLATDDATTLDAVLHALDWRLARGLADPVRIVLLQVTSPFRSGESLRAGIDLLQADTDTNAVIGMRRLPHGAAALYGMAGDGYLQSLGSDRAGDAYVPNGAFYAIKVDALRRERRFVPSCSKPLPMDDLESLDIDTEYDWMVAETAILAKNR